MAVKFQLVFNGNLDRSVNLVDIMPTVADILSIDAQFLGTYFTGRKVVLTDTNEFKRVQKMQKELETIGIYCDIKPITESDIPKPEKDNTENTSSIKLSKNLHYKSTFKTPDTDQHNLIELNMDEQSEKNKLNPIDMEFDDTLYTKMNPKDDEIIDDSEEDSDDDNGFEFDDKWKG